MRIHRTTAILALAAAIPCGVSPGFGRNRSATLDRPRPTITLRVVNDAGVESRTLALAGKKATAIFDRSGVDLVFLDCEAVRVDFRSDNACHRDRGPAEFWFRITARTPKATTDEMLGFTELDEASGSGSAGVYYPAAVEVAKKCRADVGQILGAAIAHEVGHLILGANAHTSSGVMYPHWGPAQFLLISIDELSFTSDQAKLLQNEVRRRTSGSAETPWTYSLEK